MYYLGQVLLRTTDNEPVIYGGYDFEKGLLIFELKDGEICHSYSGKVTHISDRVTKKPVIGSFVDKVGEGFFGSFNPTKVIAKYKAEMIGAIKEAKENGWCA